MAFVNGAGDQPDGCIGEAELKKICRELFDEEDDKEEWEGVAIHLGYSKNQIDCLKRVNPSPSHEEKKFMMVKRWYDVVIQCQENARKLLAAAFASVNNNRAAMHVLHVKEVDDSVAKVQALPDTVDKVKQIEFDVPSGGLFGGGGAGDENGRSNQFKQNIDETKSALSIENYSAHLGSVGAVRGSSWTYGTAFRVGSRYVMTAAHVADLLKNEVCWTSGGSYLRDDVGISFNNDPNVEQGKLFRIKFPPVFARSKQDSSGLDIAVFEFENPQNLPTPFNLCQTEDMEKWLPHVYLIGFGHPSKKGKRQEKCKVIQQGNNVPQLQTASKYIHSMEEHYRQVLLKNKQNADRASPANAYADVQDPNKMCFSIFMEHGASGGPFVHFDDNGAVFVVAVLIHGLPEFLWDIPETDRELYPREYRFEMGSRMSAVYKCMYEENPELAEDLFKAW